MKTQQQNDQRLKSLDLVLGRINAFLAKTDKVKSAASAGRVNGNGMPKAVVTKNGTKIPMKAPITSKDQLSKQGRKNVTPAKGSIAAAALNVTLQKNK